MLPTKLPPGPKGNLIFNRNQDFRQGLLSFLQRMSKEYPNISRVKLGSMYFVQLSNEAYIEHVFQHRETYVKINEGGNLRFLLGNGLLTSEGEFWMKQRKLIQPVFHKQRLQGFVQKIVECTEQMLLSWEKKTTQQIDMFQEMTRVTLHIVGKTLLSTDVSEDFGKVSKALTMVLEGIQDRRGRILKFPYWFPLPEHLRMRKNKRILDETIMNIINQRRAEKGNYDDLLTMLMEVEDADTAERMTDVQLRDEALTIFIAGHETTANAMSFMFYLLAKHPEAKKRIEEEVKRVLNGQEITYERLAALEYTTMAIKESMRLYPPAWVVIREASQDDVIDGYRIKKNDKIVLSPYTMQHNDVYWKDPEKFDPERFSPENIKSIPRYAYFPFGGGARLCIGNNFAMMEMQIILAMVVTRFNFKLPDDFKVALKPLITLRPANGIPLHLELKHEQAEAV